MTVQELRAALEQPSFTARDEGQLKQAGQDRYGSYYDQLIMAAQQAQQRQDQALEQQLSALLPSFERSLKSAQEQTARSLSQASNAAISRGMGRSSYTLANMANIGTRGAQTVADINEALSSAQSNIAGQRSLLEQQLAQTLQGYQANRASDIASFVDQQRDQDYARQMEALQYRNSLLAQLQQLQMQEQQLQMQQEQHNLSVAKTAGKSSGSKRSASSPSVTPSANSYQVLPDLWRLLGVSKTDLAKDLTAPKTAIPNVNTGGRYTI